MLLISLFTLFFPAQSRRWSRSPCPSTMTSCRWSSGRCATSSGRTPTCTPALRSTLQSSCTSYRYGSSSPATWPCSAPSGRPLFQVMIASQHVTCADLARCQGIMVHALLFDEARTRWLDFTLVAVYTRDLEQAQWMNYLNQGPVVKGLLGKCRWPRRKWRITVLIQRMDAVIMLPQHCAWRCLCDM